MSLLPFSLAAGSFVGLPARLPSCEEDDSFRFEDNDGGFAFDDERADFGENV